MAVLTLFYLTSVLFATLVDGRAHSADKYVSGNNTDVEAALEFLQKNDVMVLEMTNKAGKARWNYASNLTEHNKKIMLEWQEKAAEFRKETWKNATQFAWKNFLGKNDTIYTWFKRLAVLGMAALPEDKLMRFNNLVADMQDVYAKAKVCRQGDSNSKSCNLALEPELTEILKKSRKYEELKHVWEEWREVSGKKVKSQFLEYIDLVNEAAKLNGFNDGGELWRETYESDTFEEDMENLWKDVEPFYKQLHAYVRKKLMQTYTKQGIVRDGPIPAHLLGNMWAQRWSSIFDILNLFPHKKAVDVSDVMKEKKMTPLEMFKISEEFFTSLGLIPMTSEFWRKSIIEKPKDREMVCHASAWDFYNGKDFRIKMCTRVNMEDLITVHHEMGHVEYYLQYAHQPAIFRRGANPGFHEAVGDVLALSVATPSHLKKVGLLKEVEEDQDADISALLKTALDKIAFLPFGYLIDAWRWKVFNGEITKDELNSKWWEMRLKYQGLCPPVKRSEDNLDAAAKYHVIADVPYIRYFVSHIIQFQFHKALCDASGYVGPLHKCDIYRNKKAGKLLNDTLSLGSSVHWTKAMSIITEGKTSKIDAKPLIEYFEPLMKWLKKQNENEYIGWKSIDPMMCPEIV